MQASIKGKNLLQVYNLNSKVGSEKACGYVSGQGLENNCEKLSPAYRTACEYQSVIVLALVLDGT